MTQLDYNHGNLMMMIIKNIGDKAGWLCEDWYCTYADKSETYHADDDVVNDDDDVVDDDYCTYSSW